MLSGHAQRAARRHTRQSARRAGTRGRTAGGIRRLALVGSHAPPDLRSRTAAERRLLAAHRLHGTQADYESVCANMRLADGTLWPMPITLDVSEEFAKTLKPGDDARPARCRRRDAGRRCTVEDIWTPDREAEAQAVFGTTDREHPASGDSRPQPTRATSADGSRACSCRCTTTYKPLRQTPAELRDEFAARGWTRVVAFQTRNPMHRAHHELTLRAAREDEARSCSSTRSSA